MILFALEWRAEENRLSSLLVSQFNRVGGNSIFMLPFTENNFKKETQRYTCTYGKLPTRSISSLIGNAFLIILQPVWFLQNSYFKKDP